MSHLKVLKFQWTRLFCVLTNAVIIKTAMGDSLKIVKMINCDSPSHMIKFRFRNYKVINYLNECLNVIGAKKAN